MPLDKDRKRPKQREATPNKADQHRALIKYWSKGTKMRELYDNYVENNIINDKVMSFDVFRANQLGQLEVEQAQVAVQKDIDLPEAQFQRDGSFDHISPRTGKLETIPKFILKTSGT